jgi:competence protein ComGC
MVPGNTRFQRTIIFVLIFIKIEKSVCNIIFIIHFPSFTEVNMHIQDKSCLFIVKISGIFCG